MRHPRTVCGKSRKLQCRYKAKANEKAKASRQPAWEQTLDLLLSKLAPTRLKSWRRQAQPRPDLERSLYRTISSYQRLKGDTDIPWSFCTLMIRVLDYFLASLNRNTQFLWINICFSLYSYPKVCTKRVEILKFKKRC